MSTVYILYSQSGKHFYTGSSRDDDAALRLQTHNAGRVKSTKAGRPWKIVYSEYHDDYRSARKRELFLKSGIGRTWVKEKFSILKNNGAGAETCVRG